MTGERLGYGKSSLNILRNCGYSFLKFRPCRLRRQNLERINYGNPRFKKRRHLPRQNNYIFELYSPSAAKKCDIRLIPRLFVLGWRKRKYYEGPPLKRGYRQFQIWGFDSSRLRLSRGRSCLIIE